MKGTPRNRLIANQASNAFLVDIDPELLRPPTNVLRLSLHPNGMAPRIVNLAQWRAHIFARLKRLIEVSADPILEKLLHELMALPAPESHHSDDADVSTSFVVPLRLATEAGVLSFISTTTVFGTPLDITLSELALETFFPADATTAAILRESRSRATAAAR